MVSNEMVESLVKEISFAKVRVELVVVGKNVCLRNNGLSPKFFLEYWDDIVDAFTTALQDVFHLGRMLAKWNEGIP